MNASMVTQRLGWANRAATTATCVPIGGSGNGISWETGQPTVPGTAEILTRAKGLS